MDFSQLILATEISMYSDASHAMTLGMGGVCENAWTYAQGLDNYITKYEPSIEYLELFALLATVLNWIHRFQNRRIILFVTIRVLSRR